MNNKNHPLVSIALITYNHEGYIEEALESCLQQDYPNYEICIADDCSTDNTQEIVKKYQLRYPDKIKYNRQKKNMGQFSLAFNVNAAYKLCQGKYIAILEGDDVMLDNRLSVQVGFLERNNDCVAVSHKTKVIFDENEDAKSGYFKWIQHNKKSTKFLINYGNQVQTPTVMFRRNVYGKVVGDNSLSIMVDWCFMVELSMYGEIGFQDLVLTQYRHHRCGVSQKKDLMHRDRLVTLAIILAKYPEYLPQVQQAWNAIIFADIIPNLIKQKKIFLWEGIICPFFVLLKKLPIYIFRRIKRKCL